MMLMTGVATLALLMPLARRTREHVPLNTSPDATFYEAQINDIQRDQARGLISPDAAEQARVEAGRRLLHAAHKDAPIAHGASHGAHRVISGLIVICVPIVSLLFYHYVGSPDKPDQPLIQRLKTDPALLDMNAALSRVEAHLAKTPDDVRGWQVVAPIYLKTGRYKDAVDAFENIVRIQGETPITLADYAEALVLDNQGIVSVEARALFAKVEQSPDQQTGMLEAKDKARYFLGLALEQEGALDQARALYDMMIKDAATRASPPMWLPRVQTRFDALNTKVVTP